MLKNNFKKGVDIWRYSAYTKSVARRYTAGGENNMNKAEYTRRFGSLKWWKASNRFNEVQRVAEDGSACIVRVSESMVPTIKKLVLDRTHILYLGMWQVNQNWFSTENGLTDGVEVLIKIGRAHV